MRKIFVTLLLSFFTLLSTVSFNAEAATKKTKKKSAKSAYVAKGSKKKSKKMAKNSRRRRGGSSVDLRALTTESPYTENPDGINPVETKSGIE